MMSSLLEQIDKNRVPQHVAVIMDGNGRWAKARGMMRTAGHSEGVNTVRKITEAASEAGVKFLTLYAFSTENWNRPKEEVDALMHLIVYAIERETPGLIDGNVRLTMIGDRNRLPEEARLRLERCIEETSHCTGLTLVLALSYSSRWEITEACRLISEEVAAGCLPVDEITEVVVSAHMATAFMPDPDLLIRTGGDQRISNFLLWQIAYAELFFTDILWPDFDKETFFGAIIQYQSRERRFGKISEQLTN